MSPVLGQPPRAPRSRPVKPGTQAPGLGKGTTASGKPTGAPRATGLDERQRGTPPATTKAQGEVPSHNGRRLPQTRRRRTTRTEPQHRNRCQATPAAVRMDECAPGGYPAPTGYEQPPSGWTSARPEGAHPLPATNSRRPDGRVRARRVRSLYWLRTAAVRINECAPGGYPAPTGYEQPPSGWTSERPAATPRPHNTTRATQSTAHRASTPLYKSQAAQDTVHATQPTERAHR